ncbi:hypothetical protein P7K49_035131 [Saguinus oedipus]|uniref:Pyrin domain-containing protein n=1 Tax=Saguinus oedipus TaxID=9490 RepID=A0ABQ9TWQ1_SAGOE|nr:hypothetical protein P7K49_035131 [Saguinus oedipus]
MSIFVDTSADGGTNDGLLPHLMALDQYQLEEFKLCLEPCTLMDFCSAPQEHFPHIPWANLRAADPLNLFFLLDEHFPKGQAWNVVLGIFHAMNLTSLCEEVRAKMKGNVQTQEPQDLMQEDAEMPEAAAGNVQTQECQDPNQEPEQLEEVAGNVQTQECQDLNQEPEELEEETGVYSTLCRQSTDCSMKHLFHWSTLAAYAEISGTYRNGQMQGCQDPNEPGEAVRLFLLYVAASAFSILGI